MVQELRRADVFAVVNDHFQRAKEVADNLIIFNEQQKRAKSVMLANHPRFMGMASSYGCSGRSAILAVDLRGSSSRALRIGAKATFITMQTYVPSMAYLVAQSGGSVVGLRGDGLFASFGFVEAPGRLTDVDAGDAVKTAAICGTLMIQTVAEVINPVLQRGGIEAGLRAGVGVGAGELVVTRIGWADAHELTAYGDEINFACKVRGDNNVILSDAARALYPTSVGGKASFRSAEVGHELLLPRDAVALAS